MLTTIPDVLSADELAMFRDRLDRASWVDGRQTAGTQSALTKRNQQLDEASATAQQLGGLVLDALGRNGLFVSAALPNKIFPPLFNKYEGGETFGAHVDNAIRGVKGTPVRIRTDLSATLFISSPDEYDGGELIIETGFGVQEVKLPAGHLVLYPSTSLHSVTPVTRGARIASFFWLQSMVRSNEDRATLFDLDQSIQTLGSERGMNDPAVLTLSGVYHNLLRRFADT
ncbi:Fe2+-dependent dioxygenase [Hyphococcus lacteus]|uniref:Fe2+-dependent dioxygenase n=1 Tax=Hyphococcus lacteus TaxID=3143536 RepID=A0ABV3Z2D8_9PROT